MLVGLVFPEREDSLLEEMIVGTFIKTTRRDYIVVGAPEILNL